MSARIEICLTVALLVAAAGSASAASLQGNVGATPNDPASAVWAPGSAPAYNQAAIADPYNQSDFSSQQSFGLVASQMLGAAAACEQLHANSISLGGMQAAKSGKDAGTNGADIATAQQNLLDPAATSSGTLKTAADCDRMSGSFTKLQQIQLHNQNLSRDLDQPGASTH